MTRNAQPTPVTTVRCAIYTRKSTEEGLQQDFNTLDAQREAGEAYIASQKAEGWTALPDRYDDGGFTGGNIYRPALKHLMADIEAGKVDCVVVYKVDRLSRSLLDFAQLLQVFDQHHVTFVAVTQAFSTTSSVGRLTMNMLLSFAQFERELVSERTRDKIAAARRKGKWSGGQPILGYDVLRSPRGSKLVVNEDEADRVRHIFDLYLEHEALIPTVRVLESRGWANKVWTTKAGRDKGGRPFDKCTLHALLTNVVYVGKVRYKHEVHNGEHQGIVDPRTWQRVQQTLARNGRSGGAEVRNRYGALLKGILHCKPCDCSMGHSYSVKGGRVRYRYYICLNAQKKGWEACSVKSVPAGEIELVVLEQVRAICRDPSVVAATVRQARKQAQESITALQRERTTLERELRRAHVEVRQLAVSATVGNGMTARLADLNERIGVAERRLAEVIGQAETLSRGLVDEREVQAALAAFDPVWDAISPKEQTRLVRLLVQRVDYDGATVGITFHAGGLGDLAQQERKEAAA